MTSGYIKLYRDIVANEYYFSEPFTRTMAWVDLILIAHRSSGTIIKRGIKVSVNRGQAAYDLDSLATRWQWSRGRVERFLKMLENSNQIVRQKSNVTTLISIVNYNKYRGVNNANENAGSKVDDKTNKPAKPRIKHTKCKEAKVNTSSRQQILFPTLNGSVISEQAVRGQKRHL